MSSFPEVIKAASAHDLLCLAAELAAMIDAIMDVRQPDIRQKLNAMLIHDALVAVRDELASRRTA